MESRGETTVHDISPIRAKSGTNQERTSAHNRRIMFEALRLIVALSRADLARATQLTKQAVSNIIEDLERDGLVVALDAVRKGRGQPFTPYRLVPEGAFAIGLQIDRHLTRVVVVDLVGKVIARAEAGLPFVEPSTGVKIILGLVDRARRELAALCAQSERRLVGLGVAMRGADDPLRRRAGRR